MSLFAVDKTKCQGDGVCAAVCPVGIIKMGDQDKYPQPIDKAEGSCINCGHCVAVCPHGALSFEAMPVEKCGILPEGWNLTPLQVERLLKGRRSIRAFEQKTVSRDILARVIDAACYAPSGVNRQPVKWLVIHDPAQVSKIAELTIEWMRDLSGKNDPLAGSLNMKSRVEAWDRGEDQICRGAKHLITAYAIKEDNLAAQASTIALTFLELAAVSFGLGVCWAGYVNLAFNKYPPAFEALGISRRCGCLGTMMIGYPKFKYHRIPLRNSPDIKWK